MDHFSFSFLSFFRSFCFFLLPSPSLFLFLPFQVIIPTSIRRSPLLSFSQRRFFRQVVKDFADRLQATFSDHGLLRNATVMHGGSAYESLCVKEDTDFDITVVLGEPYVAKNFGVDSKRAPLRGS